MEGKRKPQFIDTASFFHHHLRSIDNHLGIC